MGKMNVCASLMRGGATAKGSSNGLTGSNCAIRELETWPFHSGARVPSLKLSARMSGVAPDERTQPVSSVLIPTFSTAWSHSALVSKVSFGILHLHQVEFRSHFHQRMGHANNAGIKTLGDRSRGSDVDADPV